DGNVLKTAESFNYEVKNSYTIRVRTTDLGGLPFEKVFTISVSNVNEAPSGTNNTVTMSEDGVYTFAAGDFSFTDPNDSPANKLLAVKITTLPGAGVLKLDGVAVNAGDMVSAADIAANKLTFTPAANANGVGYASFTFQVQDDGGTPGVD